MYKFSKYRDKTVALALSGLLLSATVACSKRVPTSESATAPSSIDTTDVSGQCESKVSNGTPNGLAPAQLPPLMPIEGEEQLKSSLREFVELIQSKKIEPGNELKAIDTVLKSFIELIKKRDCRNIYMYKYSVRYLVERAIAIGGDSAKSSEVLQFFVDGEGNWKPISEEWVFKPFEEANYAVLFGAGSKEMSASDISAKGQFAFPNPMWSFEVLLAVRDRDLQKTMELHNMARMGEAPQWPLEYFRQLFSYATTRRGEVQWNEISKVFGDHKVNGSDWAEIGYGSGMIFSTLRKQLGPNSTIYGTEIDGSCIKMVQLTTQSGKGDWGDIKFITGKLNDCCLPENSVDFIHPGLVHIADGPDELLQRDWLPLMDSMKKALKPGGLVIVDNGGSPAIDKVRHLMTLAGFEEVAFYEEPLDGNNPMPIYYASYRVKK